MDAKRAAAMIAIKADSKSLDRDLAGARKKMRTFGSDLKKIAGKAWGGGAGAIGKIAGGLGTLGVPGIADTIQSVRDFEKNLTAFQITAGKTDPEMGKLRESIKGVSKETAVASEEVLAGLQTYVDLTGDVAGAETAMRSFARIAQASGAQVSDVATATAALKESMKLDPGDIETVFSGLIMQGKAGAVSLKDFAGELSSLAPQFAKFGGSGVKGIADLGAALQVTRKGFGSASEAATGMTNLMTSLARHAGKFQAAGVRIFDKDPKTGAKRFRSFLDIVDAIGNSSLAKDPKALTDAFGSVEAQQAYDMLHANRQELEKIYSAGLDAGAVARDLGTKLASPTGQLETAMNNLKLSIAEAFTPERIAQFASALENLSGIVNKVISGWSELRDVATGGKAWERAPSTVAADKQTDDTTNWFDTLTNMATGGAVDTATRHANRVRVGATLGPKEALVDAGYNDTVSSIKGGGRREEMIRRAVQATVTGGEGPMGQGRAMAGNAYLDSTGVSQADRDRVMLDLLRKTAETAPALKALAAVLADRPVVVKMDGSAVGKTVDNAPSSRGGR